MSETPKPGAANTADDYIKCDVSHHDKRDFSLDWTTMGHCLLNASLFRQKSIPEIWYFVEIGQKLSSGSLLGQNRTPNENYSKLEAKHAVVSVKTCCSFRQNIV